MTTKVSQETTTGLRFLTIGVMTLFCRWYDNGRCSALKLTRHERWLRKLYKNVLTMCNARRAFREGCFSI